MPPQNSTGFRLAPDRIRAARGTGNDNDNDNDNDNHNDNGNGKDKVYGNGKVRSGDIRCAAAI
jgi:hypothetical protein